MTMAFLLLGSWVIASAHRFTERNVWVKFNEKLSNGSGKYVADTNLKGKSYDLELWHWPWYCIAESCVRHTLSEKEYLDKV